MSLSAKMRRAPLRAVTGAYILNSGVGKLSTDDETAKTVHGTASNTYGFLANMQPRAFTKTLGVGEMALGAALLLPIAPPVVVGAALVGYSGALLNVYWRTPGLHQEGNPRPTIAGSPLAKDVWMFGIGTGLIADALLEPAHDKRLEVGATVAEKRAATRRQAKRQARRQAAKAAAVTQRSSEYLAQRSAEHLAQGKALLADAQEHAAKRAERTAKRAKRTKKRAQKRVHKATDAAGKRLGEFASHAQDSAGRVKERVAS